jgi:sugar phosphate isomerase/epimerase
MRFKAELSRRSLLALAALSVALPCALLPLKSEAAVQPKTGERHYSIGLQMYTVRDECAKDFAGTLKAVSKIGFSGVEFAGYYGLTAPQLRKLLDEDHLQCYGSHIQLSDLLGDNFAKTVEYNKVLGNHLLVVASLPEERRNTKDNLIATAHLFSDLATKLKPYGMFLGFHNHYAEFQPVDGEMPWYTFFNNASNDVKIQFDTGNALSAGAQAMPFLTKYPGRVISAHVKDFSSTNKNAMLGEGDVHWNEVIPFLKSKNGPRWMIIEQEEYPFPSLVCAEKCYQNLLRMLKEIN